MELINNFGIEPRLLAAQVVNFLIVLIILRKFLYKPILDTLKKRKDKIADGLKMAEEARVGLEKLVQDEKNILKNAQDEGKKLIDDARKEASEMIKQAEELTKIKAQRLLEDARSQIALETKEAANKLEQKISILTVAFIQKSITSLFSKDDQKIVMKNVLSKLKKKTN